MLRRAATRPLSIKELANVRRRLGRTADSEQLLVQAAEMFQRILPADHDDILDVKNNGGRARSTLITVGNLGLNYKDGGRAAEAIPLLEEAYRGALTEPNLPSHLEPLIEAYAEAADPSKPGHADRVAAKVQGLVAFARDAPPNQSLPLAGATATVAREFLLVAGMTCGRADPPRDARPPRSAGARRRDDVQHDVDARRRAARPKRRRRRLAAPPRRLSRDARRRATVGVPAHLGRRRAISAPMPSRRRGGRRRG
jgi:hypothetical protein